MCQVGMKTSLVDHDGKVLWENPSYLFRSQYELSQDAASFFEEHRRRWIAWRTTLPSTLVSNHRWRPSSCAASPPSIALWLQEVAAS